MLLEMTRQYRRRARARDNPLLFSVSVEIDGRRWVTETWRRNRGVDYYDGLGVLWVQVGKFG